MSDQMKEEQAKVEKQSVEQTVQIEKDQNELKDVKTEHDIEKDKPKIEKRSIEDEDKEGNEKQNDEREVKKLKTGNEKEEEEEEEESKKPDEKLEEEKIETKPKFVFGAATSFGSGFAIAKNIIDNNNNNNENDKKDNEIISQNTKKFAFGSQFAFGSGFNILKEKKLDGEKSVISESAPSKDNNNDDNKNYSDVKSTTDNNLPEKNIKLHKQEVKSGEETETCLFQANMKLYQLHNIKEGWKERGIGILKLNKDDTTQKSRIVMRSRGILKVILNLPLIKGFSIKKGFPGSLQSEKFIRIIALDDKNLPVTYALKCGNPSLIDELYDKMEDLIQKD